MSSTTANTLSTSTTATIAPASATNATSSRKMTSSGSKAVGGGEQQQSGAQQSKPSAWSRSSVNPVTGRPSGSPVQNGIKSNGAPHSNAVKMPSTASKDVGSSDKLSFLFTNMRGQHVTLLHKNGDRYNGIFSTLTEGQYTIKMAKKLSGYGRQANGVTDEHVGTGSDRTLLLKMNDIVDLAVNDVRFDKSLSRGQNGTPSNFRTDTDISSGFRGRERNLQKWEPAESGSAVDMSLENGDTSNWDQFAAHKKMTGLESTYDENNYTTPLNKSQPDFSEKQRRADQLAREIEGTNATNAHVAEERGIKPTDDSGLDEEAKYSGVQRDYKPLSAGPGNRYTPPAMRPPTGQPGVHGAPVDPAIISSAFAKPKPSEPVSAKKTDTPAVASAEQPKPAVVKETAAQASIASKPTEKANTPLGPIPAFKSSASTALPPARTANKEGGATATVERDVHEAFKEFNKTEKLRVQEHQRTLARRDKAVKLNDLKKFAQNFKLNTEVPADLLPILARDEIKQREIKEKAKKLAEETKSTPPRSTATSVAATTSDTKSKPAATRNDSGPTSPLATAERQPPTQRSRQSSTNMPGAVKGGQPYNQSSHRQPGQLGNRLAMNTNMHRGQQHQPGPIPDPRMQHTGIASPTGSLRFDPTKSFVPSVASKAFVPGGSNASSNSSPVRAPSSHAVEFKAPTPGNLFEGRTDGRKGLIPDSERVSLDNAFNPIPTLREENMAVLPENKRANPPNDGLPPPHKTPPTWNNLVPKENSEKTVKDMFPTTLKPAASPQNGTPNQFQHQLPAYGAHPGFQHQPGPNQTPRHLAAQPHPAAGTPHHFEGAPNMQFSQSTSSVHPSPRPDPRFMYASGPPGQHFPPGAVYGTSPGGGYGMIRQVSNNPGHFQGQAPQMVQGQPVFIQGPNGMVPAQVMYQQGGQPTFFAHQPHMMAQQGQSGYPSPANRPVPMAHQNSQSGHNTPQGMTPYFQHQQPVPQMRYNGPQHHQQFANQTQHFNQHPGMQRGPPSGQFSQQMLPNAQGMIPNAQVGHDAGDKGE